MDAATDDPCLDAIAQSLLDDGDFILPLPDEPGKFDFSLALEPDGGLPALETLESGSPRSFSSEMQPGTVQDLTAVSGWPNDSITDENSDQQQWPSSIPWQPRVAAALTDAAAGQSVHGALGPSPFGLLPPCGDSPHSGVQEFQLPAQQQPQEPQRLGKVETAIYTSRVRSRSAFSGSAPSTNRSGGVGKGDSLSPKSLTARKPSAEEHKNTLHPLFNLRVQKREAQRRYRVRQKEKLQVTKEKVVELTHQLQNVKLELQTLTQRYVKLERLLAMQQATATQMPDATGGSAAIEGQLLASEGFGGVSPLLCRFFHDASSDEDFMENAFNFGGELLFTVRSDAPLRLTQRQVAALREEEFDCLWKEYINAYAVLLIEADGNPDTNPGHRLARLIHEGGQLKASLLGLSPDRIHHKLARSRACSDDCDEVWRSVIRTSRLSDEQKGAIVALRNLYLRNMGLLSRRRKELTTLLQTELLTFKGPTLGSKTYSHTLSTMSTMDSLSDTLHEEHTCLLQFILTVVQRVLTSMQVAHIHVTCHPCHVNILAIAEALAQKAGEPKSCFVRNAASQEPLGTQLEPINRALPRTMRAYTRPGVDLAALYPHLSPEQRNSQQASDDMQQGPVQQPSWDILANGTFPNSTGQIHRFSSFAKFDRLRPPGWHE